MAARPDEREQAFGRMPDAEVPAAQRRRIGLGKLAIAFGLHDPAERLLAPAAAAAPRYKPAATGLIRLAGKRGDVPATLRAAARYYAASLDPAPLRNVCDEAFRAGMPLTAMAALLDGLAGGLRVENPVRERLKRAAAPADGAAFDRSIDAGALRAQMTFAWLRTRPDATQQDALFAPIDWSPVEAQRAAGRPVILASAHIGPELMALAMLPRAPFPLSAVSAIRQVRPAPHLEHFNAMDRRGTTLARLARRLRDGRVVNAAPDERFGGDLVTTAFFGGPARLSPNIAHLAHLTDAASFLAWADWRPDGRIGLNLRELPAPPAGTDETWAAAWLAAYVGEIERVLLATPGAARLFAGIWRRANWTDEETARWRTATGG